MFLSLILGVMLITLRRVAISTGGESVRISLVSEVGETIEILGSQCKGGMYFQESVLVQCVCVTGIWAIYKSWCSEPLLVIGGIDHCFQLVQNVSLVTLLSSPVSARDPFLTRMSSKMEVLKDVAVETDSKVYWNPKRSGFLTFGETSWEFFGPGGQSRCLLANSNMTSSYCHFSNIGPDKIVHIRQSCDPKVNVTVLPDRCFPFITVQNPDTETEMTKLCHGREKEKNTSGRAMGLRKRGVLVETLEDDLDLDDIAPPLAKSNTLILNQLSQHIENEIQELIDGKEVELKTTQIQKWPVLNILQMSLDILKRTCTVVLPKVFDLILLTLVDIQVNSIHIKEPPVDPAASSRIEKALTTCFSSAISHNFVPDLESLVPNKTLKDYEEDCTQKNIVSDIIEKYGERFQVSLPIGHRGAGFEPIVETVWKALVNAHSYCYKFFSDYYNDHHTYVVDLLPFFSNEIQEIWMPPSYDGDYIEPQLGQYLYGGLLGDHRELLRKVDLCVAASRIGSPYAWYMNRPPRDRSDRREWRKRSPDAERTFLSNRQCIQSTTDFQNVFHFPKCG